MELQPWWGPVTVPVDEARRWRVGPLSLEVSRRAWEWRVHWAGGSDPLEESLGVAEPFTPEGDELDGGVQRFASSKLTETLRLDVALADRPVVVKPEAPFVLLPKDEVLLYLSTPVWVQLIAVGPEQVLAEVPSFVMSDTWWGRDTRSGELAYASRTLARLTLDDFQFRPGRAVTPVKLRNRGASTLDLTKLVLPARQLLLYVDEQHRLWTDTVTATGEGSVVEVDVPARPPDGVELLSGPRQRPDRLALNRLFGGLFG